MYNPINNESSCIFFSLHSENVPQHGGAFLVPSFQNKQRLAENGGDFVHDWGGKNGAVDQWQIGERLQDLRLHVGQLW